jgi:hypothetical protein
VATYRKSRRVTSGPCDTTAAAGDDFGEAIVVVSSVDFEVSA